MQQGPRGRDRVTRDMKYVALLRGINVGGRNIIKMAALKVCLEQQGFRNVATFIQSGNVIFESDERNAGKLTMQLEGALSKMFDYDSRVVLRSRAQLKAVVLGAPTKWKTQSDLRCNIAFLREPVTARHALGEVDVNPQVDSVQQGKGVLYLSTLVSGIKKEPVHENHRQEHLSGYDDQKLQHLPKATCAYGARLSDAWVLQVPLNAGGIFFLGYGASSLDSGRSGRRRRSPGDAAHVSRAA